MTQTPPVLDLIRKRISSRAIDPAPLHDEVVHALLEAARWEPSWGNLQPWRFVVVRDPEARAKVTSSFTRGNVWTTLHDGLCRSLGHASTLWAGGGAWQT